jgi:beta-glucosidase
MVKRILAAWYLVGQDKGYPTASFNSWKIGTQNVGGTHKTNVRSVARDGIVLLKNTNGALPLNKPKSIAVIGSDAVVAPKGANACADRGCNDGTLAMGWGSGTAEFPVRIGLKFPWDFTDQSQVSRCSFGCNQSPGSERWHHGHDFYQ